MSTCEQHDNGCDFGCAVCNYAAGQIDERKRIAELLTQLPQNLRLSLMVNNQLRDGVILEEIISLIKRRGNDR
jgi:hypothetical protein